MTAERPSILNWALGASLAVHAGLALTMPGAFGLGRERVARHELEPLRVALMPTPGLEVLAPDAVPMLPMEAPLPVAAAWIPATIASLPPPSAAARAAAAQPGTAPVQVVALAARERLGFMLDRQISDFPVEIDTPVRVAEPLATRYPEGALQQRHEGNVVLWAVVNEKGEAEEVDLAYGDAEFADAAIAAVKAGRFTPATNRLKPIRYPIALEFRFVLGPAAGATASATAAATATATASAQ